MTAHTHAASRLATRLAFLVAGFGIACWAPLVPLARARLAVTDGVLGLLLLCIGVGSVAAMMLTGPLIARFGGRPVIVGGGLGVAVVLPLLAIAPTAALLGGALFGFGAALGALDVAMNVHAVEVERRDTRPLMSGFHALFSVGGFAGAGMVTWLLSLGLTPLAATLACAVAMLAAMSAAAPRLLDRTGAGDGPPFAVPSGLVLLLAALAAVTFLVEGAMLDWSALLVTRDALVSTRHGGIGYMAFSVAMTIGRFGGDAVTYRYGDRAVLAWGGLLAVGGFVVLMLAAGIGVAVAGFGLIGLGASNIVPVLFRKAGSQTIMPPALAIGAITTTGYAGILIGPAAIGFVAQAVGLRTAFWLLALLIGAVPIAARAVAPVRPLRS